MNNIDLLVGVFIVACFNLWYGIKGVTKGKTNLSGNLGFFKISGKQARIWGGIYILISIVFFVIFFVWIYMLFINK